MNTDVENCGICARRKDRSVFNPAQWTTPMGNVVCEQHRKAVDKLYRITDARCVPIRVNPRPAVVKN